MMRIPDCLRALPASGILLVLMATPMAAQQIVRVTPEAAEAGDLVIITGVNLGGTAFVRFGAEVGGAVGFMSLTVVPILVTLSRVTAAVPSFGNFVPPGAFPPSNPVGIVEVQGPAGFSNSLSFFYMEQTGGTVTTAGLGTTQGGLFGRPVISFFIFGGPPTPGNTAFLLTLENATPLATAALAVGMPGTPPYAPYLDGLVALDLLQPFFLLQPFGIDPAGDVIWNAPLPAAPINATIMAQWVVIDPVTNVFGISNGLRLTL